ncbi:phosphatidate phosphatase LPIN3-like isoform X2 [Homarus americanus]|uniref:phosphatidate phosphatase LPIN3-like isoform X2 n=1 Tax=Homarus americanus TaxID=6706 RepID=UPI001C471D9D|nr:phosphatidate phosphatase LPIN3-like isoform X2 [Homarus americanus]
MNYIGKFISNFKDFYNEINAATLTGAIDVVVVRQEDGTFLSSPFHVRFGKMGVLRSREKVVDIEINGEPVDIHMKLGETGEAFFVEELEDGVEISPLLGTSPLPPSVFQEKLELAKAEEEESKLQDSGVDESISSSCMLPKSNDTSNETIVPGNQDLSESTLLSDTLESEEVTTPLSVDDKPKIGNSEIGVIQRVRKQNRGEQRDCQTQTESPTILGPVLRKGDGLTKGSSTRSLNTEISSFKRNALVEGQGSKTDGEETVKVSKSNRRKRKKRCNGKKQRPKSSGSQSSDTSTTSEVADLTAVLPRGTVPRVTNQEGIFVMDDIESTDKSTSLPLLREKSQDEVVVEWSGSLSRSMGPDFHPFSDTDLSPPPSPSNSRPPTPIKSDTEYEVERQREDFADCSSQTDENKWCWMWGELPTPPPKTPTRITNSKSDSSAGKVENDKMGKTIKDEDDERSVLSSMFSFMRATKKARHNPESEGIYLDDLNLEELDPEVAALYFPRNFKVPEKRGYNSYSTGAPKDEDAESGNGPSLPQSPHSVEGAIGGPKICSDSDFEDSRHPIFDYKGYHDIAFSLCGRLHEYEGNFPESLFLQSLVTYDDFCENPQILDNPDLVVRFGGKYLNWNAASPQILSLVLFQRSVPQKLADELGKEHMPKKETRKRSESKGYSWFSSWRRNNQTEDLENNKDAKNDSEKNVTSDGTMETTQLCIQNLLLPRFCNLELHQGTPTSGSEGITNISDSNVIEVTAAETQTSLPGTPRKKGVHSHKPGTDSSESEDLEDGKERKFHGERFKKSLRLSSDQITQLNLREGSNEALFSVTTAYQGTTRCKCHIFLWNFKDKIVVSDIDGTITKSDVLGHLLPILGKDWAQSGVAQLFTKIKNNGYHFLYLSARAIGQARITRDYLRSIKQGDLSLPDGPLLLNPTSLVQAFHREVIEKKPEEFKKSCLRDIQALYPSDKNPFYSGYGNKINDVWAYRAVGIPISRIFTINHRGELKHELTQTFQSSSKPLKFPRSSASPCPLYSNLSDISNHMFPPVAHQETLGEYSSLQYWRPRMPDVSDEIEAVLAQERGK